MPVNVRIRVKPGSSRTGVGGRYGDDVLVVAVQQPAVDGRATLAALTALAKALRCRRDEVVVVGGRTSRTKLVRVPETAMARYRELLDA